MRLLLPALLLLAPAATAAVEEARLPLELEGTLRVARGAGEPPFVVGAEYACVFGRSGQFSLHMPPQNYHNLGVHTFGSGKATDADTLACSVPPVVTAGNTTVCVMPPNATRTHFPAFRPAVDAAAEERLLRAADGKKATCGVTPCEYPAPRISAVQSVASEPRLFVLRPLAVCLADVPRFLEHFTLFAPAFSRRPYFRETEGALLVELDLLTLADKQITLSVEFSSAEASEGEATPAVVTLLSTTLKVASLASPLARGSCDAKGRCHPVLPLRIPFPLTKVPVSFDADTTIKLTLGDGKMASHTRRLIRAAPPAVSSGLATFQVDHETQALLRDGVPFVMSGWFAGGYGFESAGLPPATFVGESAEAKANPEYLSVLGQASLTTQWARDGVTFVRSGSWSDPALAKIYLDAAAAAGVSVLWNVGVDSAARAMGRIKNTKTNQTGCGTDPTVANWEECEKELTGYVRGNVTMVMDHPAIGGYYACDDCCHMPVLNEYGDVEYRMEAAIKGMIRQIDPYRLMFGSIACGETWYWTEEGAGLAMDVMMKEGYGGAVGNGFPYPAQYRIFPMTYEPLVLMPDPAALSTPHVYRAHSYSGAAVAGMFHTNAFVENNDQFGDWQVGMAVAQVRRNETKRLSSLPFFFSSIRKIRGGKRWLAKTGSGQTQGNLKETGDVVVTPPPHSTRRR